MSASEIVYLGPPGTFAYEVAKKRYGHDGHTFVSEESVPDVCQRVVKKRGSRGVVPIDNSSGGSIYPSVDALLDERLALHIEEELSLNVTLALLGRQDQKIDRIFTHFVPKRHCKEWLDRHYPNVELIETSSTAAAAREAAQKANAAAISNRIAAGLYHMDVLQYPIPTSIQTNVTHFFVIGTCETTLPRACKTSLAVRLNNSPGSLYAFLKPFAEVKINLSRIISRPIEGRPREFAFFIDIDEGVTKETFKAALNEAKHHASYMRVLGSYPCFRTYTSK